MKSSMNGLIQKLEWELFDIILFIALYLAELFPKGDQYLERQHLAYSIGFVGNAYNSEKVDRI